VIHHFGDWAPDDSCIAFSSNRRRGEFFDVYIAPLDGGPARCVLQQDGANYVGKFLPDGHHLLVRRVHGNFDIEAFLLDLRDGALRRLAAGPDASCIHPIIPAPDGETLYALTDSGRDFVGLGAFRVADASWRWLIAEDRDLERFALSCDGRQAALVWNQGGYGQLEVYSTADWRKGRVPTLPAGVIEPFVSSGPVWSPDSRWLATAVDSPRHNLDVWLLDVERERADKLTHGSGGGLPLETLPVPELIHFPTFDKRSIPAFLYRPAGSGGPVPVVVLVHGGPESQSRPNFQAVVAYLVNLGLGVLLPNVRGSMGYGKAYAALDDVEKRMDSVRDLQHAALWLASRGIAPRDSIAVMGGSYGGFMVLAAITNFPELWAAAVDIVGIANFVTFLEHTGPWRRRHREQEYGSLEHDRELLRDISPIHKADRIRTPLMVIHGANDPRVPLHEAEQIVAAVRARGGVVELLTYQDEGHGLVRLKNRLDAYPRIGAFLERHLKVAQVVPANALRR
jgi:dipeptidyl aminopeptidase/acylaminoacyl peptidase